MSYRIVTKDIAIGDPGSGHFAFRVGDKVHEADVKANGWEDHVASPSSKAGREAASRADEKKEG